MISFTRNSSLISADQIPKNPTGKVLRRVLQDRYEQQQAGKERAKL